MSPHSREGRVIGMDAGEVRTGLALSDPLGVLASPLEVVSSAGLPDRLQHLVREYGVCEVVVGLPRTMSGEVGHQALRTRKMVATLQPLLPGVQFREWDERLTTRMAGGGKKGRRVDHLAAARILQEYLDTRGARS